MPFGDVQSGPSELGKAEDTASASGDVGVAAMTKRQDTPTTDTSDDGDYQPQKTDSAGRLWVNASGVAVPVTDNGGSLTVDGTVTANQGTAAAGSGAWPVAVTNTADTVVKPGDATNNAIRVNVVAGAGGGVSHQDETSFTEGTSSFTPVGGVFNDTITSDPTEDQAAAARITAKRALHVNLRDASGNEIGDSSASPVVIGDGGSSITIDGSLTSAGSVSSVTPGTGATELGKAEDNPHATGDVGVMVLAVRDDSLSASTSTDGDYNTIKTDSFGRLWARIDTNSSIASIGSSVTPGTSATNLGKQEDLPHATGDVGVMTLAVRKDSGETSLSGSDGDYTPLAVDNRGRLWASVADGGTDTTTLTSAGQGSSLATLGYSAIVVNVSGTYSGASFSFFASGDGTNYEAVSVVRTDGTLESSSGTLSNTTRSWTFLCSGYRNVQITMPALTSGSVSVKWTRALAANIVRTAGGGGAQIEDAAHTSGDTGVMSLAVCRANPIGSTLTDGDYATVNVDAAGRLYTQAVGAQKTIASDSIVSSSTTVAAIDGDCYPYSTYIFSVQGTYAGVNFTFEGSFYPGVWVGITPTRLDGSVTEGTSGVLPANTVRAWVISIPGLTNIRVRATAYTSGSAAVRIDAAPGTTTVVSRPETTTASHSSITSSASSVTLLAANPARKLATIYNDSTQNLYVRWGATASTSNFHVLLIPGAYLEVPGGYTGVIDGIWASANGFARVGEMTS